MTMKFHKRPTWSLYIETLNPLTYFVSGTKLYPCTISVASSPASTAKGRTDLIIGPMSSLE